MKEGKKLDSGKRRMDLLPVGPLWAVADVLTFGAAKYDPQNWRRGMDWSRLYAAAQRHLTAFWNGEDLDSESGLPHLAHAACCLMFLLEFENTHPELDDRPGYLVAQETEVP